jgi:hypothetical protein
MKHFLLFILASILCVVIALGSVLPGVTAYKEGEIERVADLGRDNNVSNSRYFVNGYRQGRVLVKHAMTAEVIRAFLMDYGVVVRETFLLDGGKTVAASQKDHTVFWDFETSREIRRFSQRIYGFYHDETKFFTLKEPEGTLVLYAYPSLKFICELIPKENRGGIMNFSLAPNDRFLIVMFAPNYPESDENYPLGDPSARTVISVNLFNLETCQEIKEFTQAFGSSGFDMGIFSPDSNFLYLKRAYFSKPGSSNSEVGSWRFNLKNYQIEKIN